MHGARKPTFSGTIAHLAVKGCASVFHEGAMVAQPGGKRVLGDGRPMHAHMRGSSAPFLLCDDFRSVGEAAAPVKISGGCVAIEAALNVPRGGKSLSTPRSMLLSERSWRRPMPSGTGAPPSGATP